MHNYFPSNIADLSFLILFHISCNTFHFFIFLITCWKWLVLCYILWLRSSLKWNFLKLKLQVIFLKDFHLEVVNYLTSPFHGVVGWPRLDARCPPNCSLSPPQLDMGQKIEQKACGSRQGQGEITQQLPSQAKQIWLGEINLNILLIKWE